jgi:hypothetical protein
LVAQTLLPARVRDRRDIGGISSAYKTAQARVPVLPAALIDFFGDAAVHDDEEAGTAGALGGLLVFDSFLHPDRARANADRGVYNFRNKFRSAKNIHDVDFFRDIFEAGVALFAEHFGHIRIHGKNSVAGRLERFRDAIACAVRLVGQTHHGHGFRRSKKVSDGLFLGFRQVSPFQLALPSLFACRAFPLHCTGPGLNMRERGLYGSPKLFHFPGIELPVIPFRYRGGVE